MAITSVETALEQFNANLDWNTSATKAQDAWEAVQYLIVNQPEQMMMAGRSVTKNLKYLEVLAAKLEQKLGATAPRANGRSRYVRIDHLEPQGVD